MNNSKREDLDCLSQNSDGEKYDTSIDVSKRQDYNKRYGNSFLYPNNTQTDSEGVMIPDFSNKMGNFSGNVNTRFEPSLSFRPHSGISGFSENDQKSFSKNGNISVYGYVYGVKQLTKKI